MKRNLLVALVVLSANAFAQKIERNGIIFKEHPYIEVVKKSVNLFAKGDADALYKLYADTAKFFDAPDPKWVPLADAKKTWEMIWNDWDTQAVKQIGYPDALQYNKAPFTVQSWWEITAMNKKTKKTAKFQLVQFDEFNKDGKIIREGAYYDTQALMAASK